MATISRNARELLQDRAATRDPLAKPISIARAVGFERVPDDCDELHELAKQCHEKAKNYKNDMPRLAADIEEFAQSCERAVAAAS